MNREVKINALYDSISNVSNLLIIHFIYCIMREEEFLNDKTIKTILVTSIGLILFDYIIKPVIDNEINKIKKNGDKYK